MFKALFGRFRARRTLLPAETTTPSNRAAVEEIWSSWRHEKLVNQPVTTPPEKLAERVSQLMRLGEYDQALQMTLSEVEREEQGSVRSVGAHPMVP